MKLTITINAEKAPEWEEHKNANTNHIRRTLKRGCEMEYLKVNDIKIEWGEE